jgi:hypothetical protein
MAGDMALLKERLGIEENTVQRMRHAEEQAHTMMHGELSQLHTSLVGEVARLQDSLQQAQCSVQEMNQQLLSERQQRAAEATSIQLKLTHAQQQADEQIRHGVFISTYLVPLLLGNSVLASVLG